MSVVSLSDHAPLNKYGGWNVMKSEVKRSKAYISVTYFAAKKHHQKAYHPLYTKAADDVL